MRIITAVAAALLSITATAQTIHVCQKDGKQIMTDQTCDKIGAETKAVRPPASFEPLNTYIGVTETERQRLAEIKARHEAAEQQWQAQRDTARIKSQAATANKDATCKGLVAEKDQVVAALRHNSTQFLNDRHRRINDEIYRLNCSLF